MPAMISARTVSILAEVGVGARYEFDFDFLLALSALSGFVLASYFSWPAILVAGAVLAPLSAIVLQNQGFGALSGILLSSHALRSTKSPTWLGRSVRMTVQTTGLYLFYL